MHHPIPSSTTNAAMNATPTSAPSNLVINLLLRDAILVHAIVEQNLIQDAANPLIRVLDRAHRVHAVMAPLKLDTITKEEARASGPVGWRHGRGRRL